MSAVQMLDQFELTAYVLDLDRRIARTRDVLVRLDLLQSRVEALADLAQLEAGQEPAGPS